MRWTAWVAVWSMLFIIVDAEIKCEFEDNVQMMFYYCNATNEYDNVLRRGLVSDRRKTFHIVLNQCQIISVELEAFYRLPALVILDMAGNKIQSLQLGVFDRLIKLSRLNLAHNLLTELPVGIFDHNRELSEIFLKGNRLKNVEPGIFDTVPGLYNLDLSHNSLVGRNFATNLFERKRDISILSLSGNDMTEANFLSIMHNLNYLFMDGCSFKEVPKLATAENKKGLRHLSLATNEITSIDDGKTFKNLINVETLNLTMNQIQFIHRDTFKDLHRLEVLDLRYNRLHVLPVEMFQNIRLLYDLRLSYNLLTDIPLNAFAGTAMKLLKFDHNNITHLHKDFLLKIEDAGLMLKILHFKNNPWQCACLRELLREVKDMEVEYDGDTYDGQHPVCVSTKDFYCKRDEAAHDQFIRMYNESMQ